MSENYEYKFVRVRLGGGTWTGKFDRAYQNPIAVHAARGWRFVQAFAPAVMGYGSAKFVDLIFEKTARKGGSK